MNAAQHLVCLLQVACAKGKELKDLWVLLPSSLCRVPRFLVPPARIRTLRLSRSPCSQSVHHLCNCQRHTYIHSLQLRPALLALQQQSDTAMSQYVSSLTPLRSAIFASGISSSVFFIGNLTHSFFGAVPMIQSSNEISPALDNKQKADLWLFFYERAKLVFVSAAATSVVSFASTAYLHPDQTSRTIAIVATIASGLIVPWTVSQMLPVNNQLTAVSQGGDKTKEAYVGPLVEKWRKAHNVRLLFGGISYLAALTLATTV